MTQDATGDSQTQSDILEIPKASWKLFIPLTTFWQANGVCSTFQTWWVLRIPRSCVLPAMYSSKNSHLLGKQNWRLSLEKHSSQRMDSLLPFLLPEVEFTRNYIYIIIYWSWHPPLMYHFRQELYIYGCCVLNKQYGFRLSKHRMCVMCFQCHSGRFVLAFKEARYKSVFVLFFRAV